MSVAAISGSTQSHQASGVTTPAMIQKAKGDLLAFFKTNEFVQMAGHPVLFRDALNTILEEAHQNYKIAFGKGMGWLFSEAIQQAEAGELLDKSIGEVFFADDVDQVAFVTDVAKQFIVCMEGDH